MIKKYRAAQVGYGQLGKPWFDYVSSQGNWQIDLYKKASDFKASSYDCVFLAIRDKSLELVIKLFESVDIRVYHFSGSQSLKGAVGIHPVYSFSKNTKTVDFRKVTWVVDSKKLDTPILDLLGESVYPIKPDLKKTYHNYLSVSANMTQLFSFLMGERFEDRTGLPKKILKDLVIQSLESERELGAESFSGPWVRNEKNAQDKDIKDLKDEFLLKNNKNFNELVEVYNEHYKL